MSASAASLRYSGCSSMPLYSHGANFPSMVDVRMPCGAADPATSYYAKMPRKKRPLPNRGATPDWYLVEWLDYYDRTQAWLARETGMPTNTVHGIYHGRTSYYRDLLNMVAAKLNVEPYELLMHPDAAMALRRQRDAALQVVESSQPLAESETTLAPPAEKRSRR